MRVYTLSDMWSGKKLRVYTASEAKGLRPSLNGWIQVFVHSDSSLSSPENKLEVCVYPEFASQTMFSNHQLSL